MYGRGKAQIEHEYQWECDSVYVPMPRPAGAFVEKDGVVCQLPHDDGASGMSPRSTSEFPQGSVLVVRRTALEDFIAAAALSAATPKPDPTRVLVNPLGTRERTTLLTLIAALAKEAKIDVKMPTKAGQTIASLIAAMGYDVAPNTIARHLRILKKTLAGDDDKAAR